MGHIFISYARADGKANAERLEEALQSRGYSTWRDTRGIDPAKDFTAEIERAIKAADIIVTCITPDTERDDSFVRREIQYALLVDKQRREFDKNALPVYVLRFADIIPPIHVVNHTWVEFWRNWDKGFEHLEQILGTPVENYSPPALPPSTDDEFREYVQYLYERATRFLDQTVIRLIDLNVHETLMAATAVLNTPNTIDLFFNSHGIGETANSDQSPVQLNTLNEAFKNYDGRIFLLGEPGAGKSIALMTFARDAAAKRLSDPQSPLPLLGLVSSWNSEVTPSLHEWLGQGLLEPKQESLKEVLEQGKALLLLDGLDELPKKHE